MAQVLGVQAALAQAEDRGVPDHVCVCSTHINQNRPAENITDYRIPSAV